MTENIDYSLHYSRWHSGSKDELILREKFYENLLGSEIKQIAKDASILDFGCGYGHLTFYLKNRFKNVIGVDSSEQQIETALKNELPVEVLSNEEFYEWCTSNQDRFDVIFLMDVLEHIECSKQIDFIRALSKTLKTHGYIYIKTPNANSLIANRWRYIDWTHHSSFTEASLEFVLKNSNFSNFSYLNDETSLHPKLRFIPRKETLPYYLKTMIRALWRIYLYSEIGREALHLKLGVNIMLKAQKNEGK